jgi:hypothetical protein
MRADHIPSADGGELPAVGVTLAASLEPKLDVGVGK